MLPQTYVFQERLRAIYEELGAEDLEPILFSILIEHPAIADMITNCSIYHSVVSHQSDNCTLPQQYRYHFNCTVTIFILTILVNLILTLL